MTDARPITAAASIAHAARRLATTSDTPRLDAEVILRHLLGVDRTGLILVMDEPLDPGLRDTYDHWVGRRATGVPVAYLTGEREFMGRRFQVGPGVLVPRPETEILVEHALRWLERCPGRTVVDVGTGSGAIALSIAALLGDSSAMVVGIDLSAAALRFAAANRGELAPSVAVSVIRGDLLAPISGPVDAIVANLPYLRPDQVEGNANIAAEPRIALEGGHDGLKLIRRMLEDAPRVLAQGGVVGLEIDPAQAHQVLDLARSAFPDASATVLPDLAGLARHVWVERSSLPHAAGTMSDT